MRTFYSPSSIISPITSIFKAPKPAAPAVPVISTPTAAAAAEDTAAEDAARKTQEAARKRQGRRSTLLTQSTPSAGLGTQRRSLLGSS